jgi:hypothetical protein
MSPLFRKKKYPCSSKPLKKPCRGWMDAWFKLSRVRNTVIVHGNADGMDNCVALASQPEKMRESACQKNAPKKVVFAPWRRVQSTTKHFTQWKCTLWRVFWYVFCNFWDIRWLTTTKKNHFFVFSRLRHYYIKSVATISQKTKSL